MNIDRINRLAHKMMADSTTQRYREKGYIYYHGLRTAKLALNLRKALFPTDSKHDDLIYVACLFHDISKGNEPHDLNGSIAIQDILADECSKEELEYISNIIKHHNKRKTEIEFDKCILIVQDADLLDHMGVQEVWLNFNYYARQNLSIHESIEFYESEDWHSYVKNVLDKLNYNESKLFCEDKLLFMNEFISRMKKEHEGICPEFQV